MVTVAGGGRVPEGCPDVRPESGIPDTQRQSLAKFPGGVFTPTDPKNTVALRPR